MMYDFNARDVFEMALQLERNGAAFYKKAAENVMGASYKKLLTDLSAMEVGHEKIFSSMMDGLTGGEKESAVFDPQGEAIAYLRALADTRVFFEKKIDVSSLKEIFISAIGAEKDSIVFYLGMKDMVPEKAGKSRIDAIIREEMGHIETLSRHLISLKH